MSWVAYRAVGQNFQSHYRQFCPEIYIQIQWNVKNLLIEEDIISKSVIALNVGMPDQIVQDVSKFEVNKVPYFSLLLMRFGDD